MIYFSFALFAFFFLPNYSFAAVSFSQDTNLSLAGISNGDLLAASGSSADSLSFSGTELTVNAIADASYFTLKTPTYGNALKIIPSGGTATLAFNISNLSSGRITTWTLNVSTPSVTIAHTLSGNANTWYAITVDGSAFNSYQTNSGGELTFTYSSGFSSSRVFAAAIDTSAPASFPLTSPVNNTKTSNSKPTFSWNAPPDPDLSYYQLYLDGSLDTSNITSISQISTGSLSCGNHTWYVKAIDRASNSTNSETFTIVMVCEGGIFFGQATNVPKPRLQTITSDGAVTYLNQPPGTPTGSVGAPTQTNTASFSRLLKLDVANEEVKELQKFLNSLGFTVSKQGLGSPGNETIFFGRLTRSAVKKFQCRYNIICSGSEQATGYGLVGAKTRAKLNELANSNSQFLSPINKTEQPKKSQTSPLPAPPPPLSPPTPWTTAR